MTINPIGTSPSSLLERPALNTPLDYEYSQTDVARLIKCYLSKDPHFEEIVKGEDVTLSFFYNGQIAIFPPVIPYSAKNSFSSEQIFSIRFAQFMMLGKPCEEILVPFNSGGHWIILRFLFNGKKVEVNYIDSLLDEKTETIKSRDSYIKALEGKLKGYLKEFVLSEISVHFIRGQPDQKSCGPILVANIIDLCSRKALPVMPQIVPDAEVKKLRVEHHQLLIQNHLKLDTDDLEEQFQKSLNLNEEIPEASSRPSLLDEDACPSGTFIFSELPNSNLETQETYRIYFGLLKEMDDTPGFLLKMLEKFPLPASQKIPLKHQALKKLSTSISTEANRLKYESESAEEFETLAHLNGKAHAVSEEAKKSELEKKQLQSQWDEKLSIFYSKSMSFIMGDEPEINDYWDKFHELRTLRPLSIAPFYPLLTLLSGRIEAESLKRLIIEAKQCDPYLTYCTTLLWLRLTLSPSIGFNISFIFGYDPDHIITALREVYPQDLMIPTIMEAMKSESLEGSLNLSKIATCLGRSLNALASMKIEEAINTLADHKPQLIGYSPLHRYLALAWALKGDRKKAAQLMERVSKLPDLNDNLLPPHFMNTTIGMVNMVLSLKNVPLPNFSLKPSDPLDKFIKLAGKQSPLDLDLAEEFILESVNALKLHSKHLPVVYFGIRWLASRLIISSSPFDFKRSLGGSIVGLISICAAICHEFKEIDPWIAENFKKKTSKKGVSFIVSFSSITFGAAEKEILPKFQFLNNLDLTNDSIKSLATSLTKQAYLLLQSLMTAHLMPDLIRKNPSLPAPDAPLTFIQILKEGFSSDSFVEGKRSVLFHSAASYLNKHLETPPIDRPFSISHQIIDWAKFCVFSMQPLSFTSSALETEILSFYPKTFTKESFEKIQNELKRLVETFVATSLGSSELTKFALRDALLAHHRLVDRQKTISLPRDGDSLYSVCQISQSIFGWHNGETFNEWGKRLIEMEKFGPWASELNQMENFQESFREPPEAENVLTLETKIDSKNTRGILRFMLGFWQQFHKKTEEKNIFILQGGNEEEEGRIEKEWHKDIDPKAWKKIIQKNKPEEYPKFNQFSLKDRESLAEIVANKHKHSLEVIELEKKCNRPKYIHPDDFIKILAATLLTSVEHDRKKASHSVFVESKEQACKLYQLLLEIAADRIIKRALIENGPDNWAATDMKKTEELLIPLMNQLIGAFHGPETHPSGNGPLQPHFNAAIVTSNLSLVNTHIYFP